MRNRFRFGKVTNGNARSVVYELRIVLPEVKKMLDDLSCVGVNDKFYNEGRKILKQLGIERDESAEVKAEKKSLLVRFARRKLKFPDCFDV